jgi:hypothetical protein
MTQSTKLSAALVIACAALALSAYSALRGSGATGDGRACVDQQARDHTERLQRTLADRDALVARLARAANATAGGPALASSPSSPTPPSSSQSPPQPESRPRLYAHFEVPNPAVTVTQKADGTYDIRTTDPKLSGTSLAITAVTPSGDEDTLFIQIP